MADSEEDWDAEENNRSSGKTSHGNGGERGDYSQKRGNNGYGYHAAQNSVNHYENNDRSHQDRGQSYRNRNDETGSRRYQNSEEMNVPSECLGMIIGRKGANIRQTQSDYNVQVHLDKVRCIVKVSGTTADSNIKGAMSAIQKLVDNANSGATSYKRDDGRQRDSWRNANENGKSEWYNSQSNTIKYDDTNALHNDKEYGGSNGVIDWSAVNEKAELARKERWGKFPQLSKNFYNELPEVTHLLAESVACMRQENNNIMVSRVFKKDGDENGVCDIPNPIWKFDHCFGEYPDLLNEIKKQGFEKPSPIQMQAWPILLKGEDLIGIAQTGTGKTLAFLLPAMIHTEFQSTPRSERTGPNVLVLAPTRELAIQIEKEVNKYSFRGMKAVCVYGGGSRRDQIHDIERGVEIIICTPGRLNDLIQANVIKVETVTFLILDEADRMLDMGFEPQIRKVLLDIRPDRQTVMTSATWPAGVRRLAQSYMNNPIQVCVGSLDLAATHTVKQVVQIVEEGDKFYHVLKFLQNMNTDDKVIVFCGKKVRADDLSSELTLKGFMCQCIHGSREQSDREQAIADITSGDVNILIATDVASRGLDIDDITYVLNFDFPRNIEEYVHRVGRTGRAGRTGTSISYITRSDWGIVSELITILEEAEQEVPQDLRSMAQRYRLKMEERANDSSRARFGQRGGGGRQGGGGGYRGFR